MSRTDSTATTVAVVVGASDAGIQRYTARVSCTDEAAIESIDPGVLERFFEIVDGGVGAAFVRFRAVDMTGEAGRLDGEEPLVTVSFDDPVAVETISLQFEAAIDHDGETIPNDRVRFDVVE